MLSVKSQQVASSAQQFDKPHRRFNPLRGEWVIVSPHRMNRPWDGQLEKSESIAIPRNNPKNPLCPTSVRANGAVNPDYKSVFVFENDFPALLEETDDTPTSNECHSLFLTEPAFGKCEVMCFHPWSDMTLPLMKLSEVCLIVDKWVDLIADRASRYTWVQIFENRGAIMGCSNPHPHCQIWSTNFLPNEPTIKDAKQLAYKTEHSRVLLLDYLEQELIRSERIVDQNEHWVCLVPFWAVWPFETMLIPRRHILRLPDLIDCEKESLAKIMQSLLTRYDNLFECSFPYSMGWHGAPLGTFIEKDCSHWQLHALYYPPLLRSATVKKFMVGYEMLCEVQRDLTPERAAETLRNLSCVHYTCK